MGINVQRRCVNIMVIVVLSTLKKVNKACHYSKEIFILDVTQNN